LLQEQIEAKVGRRPVGESRGRRRTIRPVPLRVILLIQVCVVVAGSAATVADLRSISEADLTPISDPTRRFDLSGLSILPPQGANWFLATIPLKEDLPGVLPLAGFVKKLRDFREEPARQPAEIRLVYARVTAHDLRTFQAPGSFESATAFVHWLRDDFEKSLGAMVTGRQRLIEFDATPDNSLGPMCARYSRLTELSRWGPFPESIFSLATRGLFCLHPHWPRRYMIDAGYSQVYLKGQEPLALDAEVQPFLNSVVFTSSTQPFVSLGVHLYRSGQHDVAISIFNRELEIDPRNAHAYMGRGRAFELKGQLDQALADYNKALEIDPTDAEAYVNRGNVYGKKGQHERAIADFNKALELNPKFALAHYNRAVTYYEKKEYNSAWDDVYKAQELGFTVSPAFLRDLRRASGREK